MRISQLYGKFRTTNRYENRKSEGTVVKHQRQVWKYERLYRKPRLGSLCGYVRVKYLMCVPTYKKEDIWQEDYKTNGMYILRLSESLISTLKVDYFSYGRRDLSGDSIDLKIASIASLVIFLY